MLYGSIELDWVWILWGIGAQNGGSGGAERVWGGLRVRGCGCS